MSYIEEKEKELMGKVIPQNKKDDFESFWKNAVSNLRSIPLEIERKKLDLPYKTFDTYQITFNTHDNTKVNAYFCVPCGSEGKKLPCVVRFPGGGGLFGIDTEIMALGLCCFSVDVRSQGGKSYDKADYAMADDYRNFGILTHGLLNKDNFYMKNIYLDAVRAVDVASSLPEVDSGKIVAYGQSQGGALSIAAALGGKLLKIYPTVPSYSCLIKRVEAASGVFGAVNQHLMNHPADTDAAFDTLSYFDINNLVSLLDTPADFFLGLADPICLPEFVYSPYYHAKCEKKIFLSPFTPHTISNDYKFRIYKEFTEL